MKILFITDILSCGGKERQLFELVLNLSKKIFPENIMIVTTKNENYYEKPLMDNKIKVVKIIREYRYDILKFLFKYYKIVASFKPDIIHSLSPMTSFYTVLLKIVRKFFFIDGTIRSAPYRHTISFKIKVLNYFNFLFADFIIANSQTGLKSFRAPGRKSFFIYNGFSLSRIKNLKGKKAIKKKFGVTTDKVVGMVANFTIEKDYKTFLLSAQRILSKRNDVTFLAIGDGQYLEKLKRMVVPECQNHILFLGSQSNVESIVNIFDVGVLCTYSEGVSNSIMEYMALGKSVVATDGGGTEELVEDGQTGFLVQPGNIEEMKNKIIQLLIDSKLGRKMGYRGKERILSEFDLEKMVSSYYNFYKNIAK